MCIEILQDLKISKSKISAREMPLAIVLADYANQYGETFPSITTLIDRTGMTKRTIRKHISALIEKNELEDTGRRVGRTGKIPVYKFSKRAPIIDQKESKRAPITLFSSVPNGCQTDISTPIRSEVNKIHSNIGCGLILSNEKEKLIREFEEAFVKFSKGLKKPISSKIREAMSKITLQDTEQALKRYQEMYSNCDKIIPQKVKHPHDFLSNEGWKQPKANWEGALISDTGEVKTKVKYEDTQKLIFEMRNIQDLTPKEIALAKLEKIKNEGIAAGAKVPNFGTSPNMASSEKFSPPIPFTIFPDDRLTKGPNQSHRR